MTDWLAEGAKLPGFQLADAEGNKIKSTQWFGTPVVIYFYPKDDTPGCTKQACSFRDASIELKRLGATVVGISSDGVESHAKFRDKYGLNFPLLADVENVVSKQFGAYREKNMYGKKSMGIHRSTFLVDASGVVAKVWKRVRVDGHDAQVIAALRTLQAG